MTFSLLWRLQESNKFIASLRSNKHSNVQQTTTIVRDIQNAVVFWVFYRKIVEVVYSDNSFSSL